MAHGATMVEERIILAVEPAKLTVPSIKSTADLELVRRAARGDCSSFHELVDRHAAGLHRLAYSLAGNGADAEDLVQETFAGAFRGLDGFEGRSSVKTWLTRILVTQVARWRRSRQGKKTLSIDTGDEAGPMLADSITSGSPGGGSGGTDTPESVARRLDVQAALLRLSPEHREVLVLREFEGMAYEEMAEALDVPRGTIESRLHRARAELRSRLKSYLP